MNISVRPMNNGTILSLGGETEILYFGDTPVAVKTENFEVVTNLGYNEQLLKTFIDSTKAIVLPQEELNVFFGIL
jgi:hypothetical protein